MRTFYRIDTFTCCVISKRGVSELQDANLTWKYNGFMSVTPCCDYLHAIM